MFIAKRMSTPAVTVLFNATVADASEVMRKNKIRRLPVVDQDNNLVGIVTDRDLREVSPSKATALSIFELNYLLAKMRIKDVMKSNVITIATDGTIEEAALLMSVNKIGGLIVVDNGKVAGVITETDIFKSFVDVMGLEKGKVRITVKVQDHIGALNEVSKIFTDLNIDIRSLVMFDEEENPKDTITMVIRVEHLEHTQALKDQLSKAGFAVTHITEISV